MVEAARRLLTDERAPRRQKLLADLIHNLSENILAEDKEEDKKWFEGAFVAVGLTGLALLGSHFCQFCCS